MFCHLRVTECPQAVYSEVVTKSSGSDYMSSGSGSAYLLAELLDKLSNFFKPQCSHL